MLTDYHVHLRPDELEAFAPEYFTAANARRYREVASERGIVELGASEHIHRFRDALTIWDHPFWQEQAVDDLAAYCAFVCDETDLRLGIEMDFVPGREDRTANLLEQFDWDYVIGSVHFVGGYAVDHPDFDIWQRGSSAEAVWQAYFEALAEAAKSGLFDIIAHPDLVKIWGSGRPWPDRDLRFFYESAVEAIADVGAVCEVSTAGLRKPVEEIYPSVPFLEMCTDAGIPIALSSDAHLPEDVGSGYDRAQALLEDLGIKELCVFERRQRRLEPIG